MKLTTDNNRTDYGNKKFNFRIDEKHQMKAIWALINLYKYKIQTPVQEIICNARDAHREVGKPDHTFKINITENEFSVRDYGSGINPDKAANIFCSIGESTKTNDNTQTGGFGIGAKSPLAYVNQFNVTSWVDGIEYKYIIAKNGELLEMNLLSEKPTKVENGTQVSIPIKKEKTYMGKYVTDTEKFIAAVRRCCLFWDNKPEFNHDYATMDVLMLKGMSNVGLYSSKDISGDYAVIDGIPYKLNNWNNRVFFFNTGEIRLHETRERLADNPQDESYNNSKIRPLKEKLDKYNFNVYINKNDLKGSFDLCKKYKINVNYSTEGFDFLNNGIYPKERDGFRVAKSESGYRYNSTHKYKKDSISYIPYDAHVFHNKDNDSQARVNRRIKNYVMNFVNKGENVIVHVTNNDFLIKYFDAKNVTSLEIPKVNRTGEKSSNDKVTLTLINRWGGYDRRYLKLNEVQNNYLYTAFNDNVTGTLANYCRSKGYKICKLSKENISAVKGHKNFTMLSEWIENFKPSEDEKQAIYSSALKQVNYYVNYSEVLDERFSKIKTYNEKYQHTGVSLLPHALRTVEIEKELSLISTYNAEISDIKRSIEKDYPFQGRGSKEENTEYINAMYSYRKNLQGNK